MIRVPGRGVAVLTFLSGLGLAVLLVAPAPPAAARNQVQKYAVLLDAEAEPDRYAAYFAERLGITVRHVFQHALNGFAADLTPAQADLLRQERVVTSVDPDGVAQVRDRRADGGGGAVLLEELAPLATRPTRQTVPIGVARVGATRSATAGINGRDDAFPVDIAVLDTGVDASHPDLNVAGSVSTVGGTTGDVHGHGTHIAGVIGARDNRTGVVGVAPGARLWSVRALDASGVGAYTDMAAGVDWVTARANTIKVLNISVVGDATGSEVLERAIQGAVQAGVTVVVAAGNTSQDCSTLAPARFAEVITVSSLSDKNGKGGRSSGRFLVGLRSDMDETFSHFSNFGPVVDMIAPGALIRSTLPRNQYGNFVGTSQAAAHVSGAAGLVLRRNPGFTPAQVRAALLGAAAAFAPTDDPDGIHEPALECAGL